MKLTATVMGERPKNPYGSRHDTESYAVADAMVDGSPALIAASLRALADAIDPPNYLLHGAAPSMPWPVPGDTG